MEITITMKIEDDQLRELFGLQKETKEDESVNAGLYSAFFNETCTGWQKDATMNKMFLLRQQDYLNEKLKAKGYLFLNEALDALGMARTKIGQTVGWIHNPEIFNHVDLGLFKNHNQDFINGLSNFALLEFNVDGDILDRM